MKPVSITDTQIFTLAKIQAVSNHFKTSPGIPKDSFGYQSSPAHIDFVEVLFDSGKLVSFFWDGKAIKAKGAPNGIYNRQLLPAYPEAPVLIVDDAPTAHAAQMELEDIVVLSWNGKNSAISKIDWTCLDGRDVFLWTNMHTARLLNVGIPTAHKVPPLKGSTNDGADFIAALGEVGPIGIRDHILSTPEVNNKPSILPPKHTQEDAAGVKCLGTGEDGNLYFLDSDKRMLKYPRAGITQGVMLAMAKLEYWQAFFGDENDKVNWTKAQDWIREHSRHDFFVDIIRGRGAWKNKDGSYCYHDGRETTGTVDPDYLYVRKPPKDIGLNKPALEAATRKQIVETVLEMSFKTRMDGIKAACWPILAPFCGAYDWRPCGLLTGPSGSGKSQVLNYVIRPLSMSLACSGNSSEAGIRQAVGVDASPVVVDENEGDSASKKIKMEARYSLMRQSTTADAPPDLKGNKEGTGITFRLSSMFMFAGIDETLDHEADEKRIFRVQMIAGDNSKWPDLSERLRKLITDESCARIRAYTWQNFERMIELANRLTGIVLDIIKKEHRYCHGEALMWAAWYGVWLDKWDISDAQVKAELSEYYGLQPEEEITTEPVEMMDRLLAYKLRWEDKRQVFSVEEIARGLAHGKMWLSEGTGDGITNVDEKEKTVLRRMLANIGIAVTGRGEIALVNNHPDLCKILERGKGFHRQLWRHDGCADRSRVVSIPGMSQKRCTVIRGLLEEVPEVDADTAQATELEQAVRSAFIPDDY
jgi:hypothetical protein